MPTQIVMDHTGDTRHTFEASDDVAVKGAMDRFAELTGKGYRAVALGKSGEPGTVLKAFDPTVEKTMFIPQLKGG
jgi:hypothetical protein